MNSPASNHCSRRNHSSAFTLLEVMIAMGIFFVALFAILGLTSQLLSNARRMQGNDIPSAALVHAWYTSYTNKVAPEGETRYDFTEISQDLGELYRDYEIIIDRSDDEDRVFGMTNGLYSVVYKVVNRRTGTVVSDLPTLYWDPGAQSQRRGMGGRRP